MSSVITLLTLQSYKKNKQESILQNTKLVSYKVYFRNGFKTKKLRRYSDGVLLFYQDLESQASASVVSSAAGASSVASAFSAASAAVASALLFANSAIRASLTLASASNLSF